MAVALAICEYNILENLDVLVSCRDWDKARKLYFKDVDQDKNV